MKLKFSSLYSIVLEGKSTFRFFVGAILSFAFSIAVILSTIGLMDGFESSLIKSLKNSSSDLVLSSNQGFFDFEKLEPTLKKNKFIKNYDPLVITQSFAVYDQKSKGVLVHGVEEKDFNKVTNLKLKFDDTNSIAIGSELASFYDISVGDELTLIFSSTKSSEDGIPNLINFQVSSIINHGVFEKDLRFVYVDKSSLSQILGLKVKAVNKVLVKTDNDSLTQIEIYNDHLNEQLKELSIFKSHTFWSEFDTLLEAVKVEKFSITLILQLIVIVSVFNILAFIIFVVEKQAQSFFLLSALGLSKKLIINFWIKLLAFVWLISCVLGIFLTFIFNILLNTLSVFKLPGDIYVLSELSLKLDSMDYIFVFSIAALWIAIIGVVCGYKLKKKSILSGLRQEFS